MLIPESKQMRISAARNRERAWVEAMVDRGDPMAVFYCHVCGAHIGRKRLFGCRCEPGVLSSALFDEWQSIQ